MWTSLWSYAPTPEQLAYQEKKKAFARQVESLDQRINDQRPEDEDEEKLRAYMATTTNSSATTPSASNPSSATNPFSAPPISNVKDTAGPAPTPQGGNAIASTTPSISSFSIIPSVELDKALTECEGALQNFILKIDWLTLFPYHDEAKQAEEKGELELLQRKLEVARYNLISKVGPYRPLDPTLLFPSQIPRIVVPALQEKKGSDELIASVAYKEEGAGLGSFDLLDLGFCERMMRESNAMAFWTELVERRGVFAAYWGFRKTSKNRHVVLSPSLKGVTLNHAAGSFAFLYALVKQAIEPVVSAQAEKERKVRVSLRPRSCKLFSYCMDDIGMSDHFHHKPETGLAINICLGRDFHGANLIINDDSGARLSVPQVAGRALVYRADATVTTETITGGERYNMVIYCDVKEEFIPHDEASSGVSEPLGQTGDATFLGLPEPLKHRILGYLSLDDLNALTLTSNALFKLVTYQSLPVWERLCVEKQYPHVKDENWRRSFINGHKVQLLKRWRDQERKREQKKLFNEGMAEGYFMHDFDVMDRFEEENGGAKKRNPWKDGDPAAAAGSNYYGVGQDGLQMPPQMWNCCVLQ